ncbi:MAG TPA: metallophosphoesterase [Puia sp.]|nr:metallophosphoesterase [Puia sp.]
MPLSRKEFLQKTLKSVFVLGVGNSLQSYAANNFPFPDRSDTHHRFMLLSDGHYGQADTNYDFHHDNMIGWVNAEKQARGLDFAVVNGDLFHNDVSFLPLVKAKWDQLKVPYYVSHGNHDLVDEIGWSKVWQMPWHIAFEKGDTGFLVLNTSDEKGNYICPDMDWTQRQLVRYQSKKHLLVFMHITPFKWTPGGVDCPDLVAMFNKQANLKMIFHGHDHDQDNVKENAGKFYFFDSHVAGNWGTEYRGFRIVEILKTGEILTYQMNPSSDVKVNEKTVVG